MWGLLGVGDVGGERGEGRRGGRARGGGGARWPLCLLCTHSTCPVVPPPTSKANTEKPLQTCRAGRLRGRWRRQHGAMGRDLRPFLPPPRRKVPQGRTLYSVAREWHLGACRRWLTSPFPSQFQRSHPRSIYCQCWQPLYFPMRCISSCIQGRKSSAAGAAFKGVVRSVLFWDGAAVLELTFRVFTSDLPHAVMISHATKTISGNDSSPMASTIAT